MAGILASLVQLVGLRGVPRTGRLVVFRFGRTSQRLVRGPGWVWVIPLAERAVLVSLETQRAESGRPTLVTTGDDRSAYVRLRVTFRVVDPSASVVGVADLRGALLGLAMTQVRAMAAERTFDELMSDRAAVAQALTRRLADAARRWGAAVTLVEVAVADR